MEEDKKEEIKIVKVTEELIKAKTYEVRGYKVMLDFDLAKIYGYSTKAFNQQVKNNSERFASDFAFKLTKEEVNNLRSKNLTSSWGGSRYLPNAFTEQGIYMLMTILKGDLAVKQSIDLVRTFKKMKDYILENRELIGQRELLQLSMETANNRIEIRIDDMKEIPHLICGKTAVGGNYNSTRDSIAVKIKKSVGALMHRRTFILLFYKSKIIKLQSLMHLADHSISKLRSFRGIDIIRKFRINGGSSRAIVQAKGICLNVIRCLVVSILCNTV